jgi:hypothetical protein
MSDQDAAAFAGKIINEWKKKTNREKTEELRQEVIEDLQEGEWSATLELYFPLRIILVITSLRHIHYRRKKNCLL